MKITIIGALPPYKGGISQFNQVLAEKLKKDHEVQVISWKRMYPKLVVKNQPENPENPLGSFVLHYANPVSWYEAGKMMKEFGTELIIFTWLTPLSSPVYTTLVKIIKGMTKAKLVAICHNVLPHEKTPLDIPLAKFFFRNVDCAIVHSYEDERNLQVLNRNLKIKKAFLPIFPAPFGKEKPKALSSLELRKSVILFFGFVRPYKGLMYLLDAMPLILKELDLDLLIVGEFWEDKKEYFEKIEKLEINDHVKIVAEYVADEEMHWYFKVADVVVLPYISGTQSAVIQTAYFFDKSVISTRVGGFEEAVEEGKTGFLVAPEKSGDLAKAVIRFYEEKKKGVFEENVKKEKERFSWERYSEILLT